MTSFLFPLQPSHSYTHRILVALCFENSAQWVIFAIKKKFFLVRLTYLARRARRCLGRLGHVIKNTMAAVQRLEGPRLAVEKLVCWPCPLAPNQRRQGSLPRIVDAGSETATSFCALRQTVSPDFHLL